jgi:serine/threonine protein kinase
MERKVDGAGNRLVQPERLGQFCKSMVSALQQMSKHGIVHNDIKPQNVIYDPETGGAKLIDFGVAKKDIKHETASRYGGEVAGTAGFVPPSGRGKKETGYERDIIAAGITVMCAAAAASSSGPAVREMSKIIREFQGALGPDSNKAIGQFKLDDKTLKSRLGELQKLVNKFDGIIEKDDEVQKAFRFGVDMIREGTQAMLDRVDNGPEIGTYRYVPKQDTPWYTEHPLDKIAASVNYMWNERPLNG